MFVIKALIAAAFAASAVAQSAVLTFTNVPNPVTDGQPQAITYSTNDTTTPVTIRLRRGTSTNLQTVSTLTESALNGQFIWTPPADLPNGNDYALQIIQNDQINYFGPFTVQGASPSAQTTSSTSSEEVTGSVTILPIPFPIETTAVSDAGSMTTLVATANGTTYVAPVGTGVSGVGNGTMMTRNATMSMATLTTMTDTTMTGTTGTATEGTTGGAEGSATTSSQAEDSTGAAVVFQAEGALALVLGAAAFFL